MLVVTSIFIALLLIEADHIYQFKKDSKIAWLFLGNAEAARSILSTIATAMITIVSLTFSMTIVVLTLATSQFGPRLLYNFMRDRGNQTALGLFLACFVFSLLILRTVHAGSANDFVPHLGTTAAMLFAAICIGMLIYYIHHIADSIQANSVIANVRCELEMVVERMLPERDITAESDDATWQRLHNLVDSSNFPIATMDYGILQAIDIESLQDWATQHDALLRLRHRPGEFVIRNDCILEIFPRERAMAEEFSKLQKCFRFGRHRTLMQDTEFAFQQLVEIALRALSPGINDPFTALTCVDELISGLALVATRGKQPRILYLDDKPRILVKTINFSELADIAFNQIRQNGAAYTAVMLRLLEALAAIAPLLHDKQHRKIISRHAKAIYIAARECTSDNNDKADIEARYQRLSLILDGNQGPDTCSGQ